MRDPYQVLGVSPQASDEQVKAAYRELARKYHPDHYANNPLADLAAEKMKEINAAYDEIQAQRRGFSNAAGAAGGQAGAKQGYQAGYSGDASPLADIRRLLAQHRVVEADELLGGIPESGRGAEWHFLKGYVLYSRGWTEDAFAHFRQAAAMDPANPEYRQMLERLQYQRQTGFPGYGRTYSMGGCSVCDLCAALWCADCCCGNSLRCCF